MSGDTQARRRKDKRKKKGRAEAQGADQWRDDVQLDAHDDDQFYVEPDSVSDDGTGDEELKEHYPESGGSGCLTVLVFLVLLAGVGVLGGLIYVQSQGIAYVETPAPPPAAAPLVQTIVETITAEGDASPPPADDQEAGERRPPLPEEPGPGGGGGPASQLNLSPRYRANLADLEANRDRVDAALRDLGARLSSPPPPPPDELDTPRERREAVEPDGDGGERREGGGGAAVSAEEPDLVLQYLERPYIAEKAWVTGGGDDADERRQTDPAAADTAAADTAAADPAAANTAAADTPAANPAAADTAAVGTPSPDLPAVGTPPTVSPAAVSPAVNAAAAVEVSGSLRHLSAAIVAAEEPAHSGRRLVQRWLRWLLRLCPRAPDRARLRLCRPGRLERLLAWPRRLMDAAKRLMPLHLAEPRPAVAEDRHTAGTEELCPLDGAGATSGAGGGGVEVAMGSGEDEAGGGTLATVSDVEGVRTNGVTGAVVMEELAVASGLVESESAIQSDSPVSEDTALPVSEDAESPTVEEREAAAAGEKMRPASCMDIAPAANEDSTADLADGDPVHDAADSTPISDFTAEMPSGHVISHVSAAVSASVSTDSSPAGHQTSEDSFSAESPPVKASTARLARSAEAERLLDVPDAGRWTRSERAAAGATVPARQASGARDRTLPESASRTRHGHARGCFDAAWLADLGGDWSPGLWVCRARLFRMDALVWRRGAVGHRADGAEAVEDGPERDQKTGVMATGLGGNMVSLPGFGLPEWVLTDGSVGAQDEKVRAEAYADAEDIPFSVDSLSVGSPVPQLAAKPDPLAHGEMPHVLDLSVDELIPVGGYSERLTDVYDHDLSGADGVEVASEDDEGVLEMLEPDRVVELGTPSLEVSSNVSAPGEVFVDTVSSAHIPEPTAGDLSLPDEQSGSIAEDDGSQLSESPRGPLSAALDALVVMAIGTQAYPEVEDVAEEGLFDEFWGEVDDIRSQIQLGNVEDIPARLHAWREELRFVREWAGLASEQEALPDETDSHSGGQDGENGSVDGSVDDVEEFIIDIGQMLGPRGNNLPFFDVIYEEEQKEILARVFKAEEVDMFSLSGSHVVVDTASHLDPAAAATGGSVENHVGHNVGEEGDTLLDPTEETPEHFEVSSVPEAVPHHRWTSEGRYPAPAPWSGRPLVAAGDWCPAAPAPSRLDSDCPGESSGPPLVTATAAAAGALHAAVQGGSPPADQPEVNSAPPAPAPAPAPDAAAAAAAAAERTVTVTVDQFEVHHVDVLHQPQAGAVERHQPVVERVEQQEVLVQPVVRVQPTVQVVEELETVVQVVEQPEVVMQEVLHTSRRRVTVQQTVVEVMAVAEDGSEQLVSTEVQGETEEEEEQQPQPAETEEEEPQQQQEEPAEAAEEGSREEGSEAGGEAATEKTDGAAESQPEAAEGAGAPVEVVEQVQVIEEHIVYVDAPSDQQQQQQAEYVEAPLPAGIQLEGSEPQLETQYPAPPPAPLPSPQQQQDAEEVVTEEKLVRMRQVVKQVTDADGNVREEIVSEEVLEDVEEPATDQAAEAEQSESDSAGQRRTEAAAEVQDVPSQEEEVSEAEVEDEPQEVEEEEEVVEEVAIPAESAAATDRVPVDTNTRDKPAEVPVTQQKPKEAVKVEEKPKEAVKVEEKPKEAVKVEEKPKEAVKVEEKPKEAVKAEEPKKPVQDKKATDPVKEEKPKVPVKEEKAKEPVKEEKPKEAVQKPKEPVKQDKPVEKPVQTDQLKEKTEPKPTESPVRKETPTEKPKQAAPTEKPVVKEVPTEKPAPKTLAKEAEEVERVRSAQKEAAKKADTPSKRAADPPAAEQKKPAAAAEARPDPHVERDTDKHAKHTGQAAPVAADEGIVADLEEESHDQADAAEYDKADVTGPEDWDIRQELDDADSLVDTDALAALNAFGAILSRRPHSPRALWGRARALNAQAAQERSNSALDKAIRAFRDVLDLDLEPATPVPAELYRQAAETCVQQMRFRGELEQAARIQQRLIQKFPDDYQLRNHLATVFMTYGQNAAAEEVLQEVLRLWPDNGYAKSHLGFIRRQEGNHEEAVKLIQAGLDSDEPGVHDKRFYYALGDSYDRLGRRDLALKIYEEAVRRGLLLSVLQRSQLNVDRLTGRPYWTAEQTGSQELIRELEANYQTIRDEMLSLLDSERPEDGFQPEQEQLSKSGDWKQYTMYRRGRKNQYACSKTPRTCEIVAKFPEAAGCRRGQVKFSMMTPGTSVWPHTGPTNCRLRLHLGLQVPSGVGIRVAGEKRTWEEGKVLIIDDSFEHDVWNEGDKSRFILIVDIWHPELTDEERRTLPSV